MPATPHSKPNFYKRYLAGEFGNRPLAWDSGAAMWASGHRGLCTLRGWDPDSKQSVRKYGVSAEEARYAKCPVHETPPDDKLVFQGECCRLYDGLHLTYSVEKNIPNQLAVRHHSTRHFRGAAALHELTRLMDPVSREHLDYLLDTYENAVVEFSTFSVPVGVLDLPTVFWEVRGY